MNKCLAIGGAVVEKGQVKGQAKRVRLYSN